MYTHVCPNMDRHCCYNTCTLCTLKCTQSTGVVTHILRSLRDLRMLLQQHTHVLVRTKFALQCSLLQSLSLEVSMFLQSFRISLQLKLYLVLMCMCACCSVTQGCCSRLLCIGVWIGSVSWCQCCDIYCSVSMFLMIQFCLLVWFVLIALHSLLVLAAKLPTQVMSVLLATIYS